MRSSLSWTLIPLVFFTDRISKIWILNHLKEGESFPVLTGVLHITRVNNTGAAFGLWRDSSQLLVIVTGLSILAIAYYLVNGSRSGGVKNFFAWALVVAGALGNLYDRVRFGYVVDYLDLRIWPVFNAADTAICIGVFFILLSVVWKHAPNHP